MDDSFSNPLNQFYWVPVYGSEFPGILAYSEYKRGNSQFQVRYTEGRQTIRNKYLIDKNKA